MGNSSTKASLLTSLRAFLARYRTQVLVTLAVLGALTLIAAQVFPGFQSWLLKLGVVQYLTLLILIDVAAAQDHFLSQQGAKPVEVWQNQDDAMPHLIPRVAGCGRADLLEYAGSTTLPLIRALCRERVRFRLLVKHPKTIHGLQRHRMVTTLDTLYNSIFDDYPVEFEIRCYRQPFSLRARRLGDSVLELGWLTADRKRQSAYGHVNPSITLDLKRGENAYFVEFFERTFEDLWSAEDTADGRSVLEEFEKEVEAPKPFDDGG
jgi:hypothetical protein